MTMEGLGGPDPLPLANQSFLLRGQVIRSPTHQAALRFQSLPPPAGPGTFHFHYQGRPGQLREAAAQTGCPPGDLWCCHSPGRQGTSGEGSNIQHRRPVTLCTARGEHCTSDTARTFPPPPTTLQRPGLEEGLTDTASGSPRCAHCHSLTHSVNSP